MLKVLWRLLGYKDKPGEDRKKITCKRLSDTTTWDLSDDTSLPVSKVKSLISREKDIKVPLLEIVDNITILNDDELVIPNKTVEFLVKTEHRIVPNNCRVTDDCIMLGDGHRVRMSCGHAITPDMLYSYLKNELNKRKTEISCCICEPSTAWDILEIFEKACLSVDERVFFSRVINSNATFQDNNVHKCLSCGSFCERIDENNSRVECRYCKRSGKTSFEFCWKCNWPWTENHKCKKCIQDVLDTCEMMTMEYSKLEVPKVRACPKCTQLLEFTGGCKTMTCQCGYVFCFSCLKSDRGKELLCGNYDGVCKVADRQKV